MLLFDDVGFVQTQSLPLGELLYFMPFGYMLTILIETPVLVAGLASKISLKQKVLCGIWLTACTYPIVVLVLPAVFFGSPRWQYLAVAETFAPAAECLIFAIAFRQSGLLSGSDWIRSFGAIVIANLASFGIGEILNHFRWFGLF